MVGFQQAFLAEWIKIKKKKSLLLIIILAALPVIYGWIIHTKVIIGTYGYDEANSWHMLIMMSQMFYGTIFFPIIISLITGTLTGYEQRANNWEHLLVIPVKRSLFFFAKMAWASIIIMSTQLLMVGLLIVLGYVAGYTDKLPIGIFLSTVLLGTIGAIGLGTLLFYFYLRLKSTRQTLMISIFLSFPSFLTFSNNSGSWIPMVYPWALPLYGMTNVYADWGRLVVFFLVCGAMIIVFSILSVKLLNRKVIDLRD
ncbi:ABC transporter permease [Bacillus halotolerans]|uniref:ABC transporter permease n=1 Tax=Bacillus halotolerans TaxID=260554 RepID=UPI00187A4F90|nr:ABC transporter permease [Bacillus halotolerans]MEC1543703.1 ABC transporter permease [Bacillus halotolerans]